ncbi:MAG: helix-turn-helix domain-containing protein [Oscillospiraceae bacterium]|nr:helix-turn-helix domain-containing protein [Oscillospiraceae bacterium]
MMNLDIGSRIKALRLGSSMTQEQLAQKLGVSAQAVSKWESGTNMPDIGLLPDLSVIFGVTIDELFAMKDERRMERIENMLRFVNFLSEEEFRQTERYLKDCRKKEALNPEATVLLAALYNKRADEYHELAKPLAREGLLKNPDRKYAHWTVFQAEGGPGSDWNMINHSSLVEFYKEVVARHPEDVRNYFWLLDVLIADNRTAEAREYAEKMKVVEYSFHYELYMGHICRAECDLPAALEWWKKMLDAPGRDWMIRFEYANTVAKLGRYDEAVEYYKAAMPLRPHPRFTDCEDAVAQICLIKGDIDGAIEMNRQILDIVREDWDSEEETMEFILREIQRLEQMK